jgi:hypothetical protein
VSELIVDPDPSVRARAANRHGSRLSSDQVQALVDDSSTEVRRAIAGSNLSQQQALELAQDADQTVVEALIGALDFLNENPRALKAACARDFKFEFKAQSICDQVNR